MRQFILDFPNQFKKGIEAAEEANVSFDKKFANLIVCGMGGSALPAEIIKMLPRFNLPVIVHRSYGLPREASENSLIFISSYSGNTEEPIDSLNEAVSRNLSIVGFSKGGEIENLCKEKRIYHIKYPDEVEGFQPRFGLGYSFFAMLKVLDILGYINCDCAINKKMEDLATHLSESQKNFEKESKDLAERLYEKLPIIYAPHNFKALSYIWKINFNETGKIPAFSNCFPELNHNEMTGFINAFKILGEKIIILNLKEKEGDLRLLKRAEVTKELLKDKEINLIDIEFFGKNNLEKFFSSILLAMWTSYNLALLYEIDPVLVPLVEDFKKLL